MEELRERVWKGSINVEVMLSDSIVLPNTSISEKCHHLVVLRESFLALYIPAIVRKLGQNVSSIYEDCYKQWWFECNGVPVSWEYPCGVLFDSSCNSFTASTDKDKDAYHLQMWKLHLCHGHKYPRGIIPLVDGLSQIQDYWKHQWKQACFILNGSAKRIMSLSIPDFEAFWLSILSRHQLDYMKIRDKMITLDRVKCVPIRFILPDIPILQPTVSTDTNKKSLNDVIDSLDINLQNDYKIVIQGIEVYSSENVLDLYNLFASIDGFLYIIIKR
ncbi:unnamed protein product [Kluyveromyces dobzhanskii CBS 2104]|uniref:Autophagy protein 5 n=1 Tax=Kluyveromyces dobzhanskii CBS 2104 TaxID=1427455 RepID=A0A0A8LCL5_9SACH|nr:unnamed protein product [Kluyveromyces dobzhanskii CBS 2104]